MNARRHAALVLALGSFLATPGAGACEPPSIGSGAARIDGRSFVLDWRIEPAPLRLGEFFALVVSACEQRGERVSRLKVDATMPAHQHGMNYAPTIASEGAGLFRASGLLLHMPGRWEFAFDVTADGSRETLRSAIELK
jgi:hypothetical protein